MINALDTVFTHIHLLRMFLPADFLNEKKKKRIGQATSDLICMQFIYYNE